MADEVSDVNIEKGVHLSVIVEFCAQNIIVVCLKNKGKEFRGVLLESDGGLFPFSFPFLKSQPSCSSLKSTQKAELFCSSKNDSSQQSDAANRNSPQTPEVPATTQRFSYNNDPFLVNPSATSELTVVEMKPIAPRTKTIRDIRLRPRQTLCSNCKSAIHEGRKTRSNSTHSLSNEPKNSSTTSTTSSSDSRLRPRANGSATQISPLKSRPPKRKSETQTPMVLLEDIKHKSTRLSVLKDQKRCGNVGAAENEPSNNKSNFESSVESLTNTTNRIRASRRSLLSETNINHEANVQLNGLAKDDSSDFSSLKAGKKNKSSHEPSSRPSPAIKISIKGGTILKIPPRFPDSEGPLPNSILEPNEIQSNDITNLQIHKKAKKSSKKAKDRHRAFNIDNALNILPNGDQAFSKSLKKHKKKHRHRHQSPEPIEGGKTLNIVFNDSNAFKKETNLLACNRDSHNFKGLLSKESKITDIFPGETNNVNTCYGGSNITNLIKEEPKNISTLACEINSESMSRESFHADVSFSTDTNHSNTLRREIDSMNTSFCGENNNAFGRETNYVNGLIGGMDNSNVCRETPRLGSFTTNSNNYMKFDRALGSVNAFSEEFNVKHTYCPMENNNVTVKSEGHDSLMGNTESNFISFEGNREATSPMQQKQIRVGDCFIDVVDISDSDSENESQGNASSVTNPPNFLNSSMNNEDLNSSRPRLLYTLKQDQGLSRVEPNPILSPPLALPRPSFPPPPPLVPAMAPLPDDQSPRYLVKTSPSVISPNANSPHRRKNASPGRVVNASPNVQFSTNSPLIKDYPLRNRAGSMTNQPPDLLMIAEQGSMVTVSEDSQSHSSGLESRFSDISGESDGDENPLEDIFAPCGGESISPDEGSKDLSKPLMLKIQTQNVTECVLRDGRKVRVGDIVWGKIQGCPWWPGRVSSITVTQTQRDNNVVMDQLANVAWFGSNTMSHVHCCDLDPFLEYFKSRYNKKKKGPYRIAIKQATQAAQKLASGINHGDILDFTD